jgi:hypothetical protein
MASRWGWGYGGRRQKPKPKPEIHQKANKIAVNDLATVEPPNLTLKGDGKRARCVHDHYLLDCELESEVSHDCQQCTPRTPDTRPVYRPSKSKNWKLILRQHDLSEHRGMAMSGGKNVVLVGGSAGAEFADNRDASVRLYGGRKRTAGGKDKIAPWQNPGVDFDGTADRADSGLASKIEKGNKDFDTGIDTRVRVSIEDLFDKGLVADSDKDNEDTAKEESEVQNE